MSESFETGLLVIETRRIDEKKERIKIQNQIEKEKLKVCGLQHNNSQHQLKTTWNKPVLI